MKSTYLDYCLSTAVIGLILLSSVGCVFKLVPLTTALFSSYHIVVDIMSALLLYGLLSGMVIRFLVRVWPIPAGSFDMNSRVFIYWKLLTVIHRLGQAALRPLAPVFVRPLVESLYGAKIGRDVALGGVIDDPYMVSVGDGTVLGWASLISGNVVDRGMLICGRVVIGREVTIGPYAVVFPNTEIGDGATLMGGSHLMAGVRVPPGETWKGNPARKWMPSAGGRTSHGD